MTTRRAMPGAVALCLGWIGSSAVHGAEGGQPPEMWRIEEGRVAPWAPPGTRMDPAYRGRELRFEASRVVAPEPLACDGAKYEWRFIGFGDLFEGNLPAPAKRAAQGLGIGREPVATLRVTCTNAGFDFHRTERGDLLLGLDNVVWTLRRMRAATTPTDIVQALLIAHFTHDMGFTRDSVARKSAFLSTGLRARIAAYLAASQTADEAPPINGDPFTDSQEYPDRFTLGAARTTAQQIVVPVRFADARSTRRVEYVLVREGADWVVDDLVDGRGGSLRALLGTAPAADFDAFYARFRAALASGRSAEIAALVRVPFLYEGRQLDTAGVARIVPELFTAAVKRCLAGSKTMPEGDRRVAFCSPYAFYFGRDAGGYRLLEFAADGEEIP